MILLVMQHVNQYDLHHMYLFISSLQRKQYGLGAIPFD